MCFLEQVSDAKTMVNLVSEITSRGQTPFHVLQERVFEAVRQRKASECASECTLKTNTLVVFFCSQCIYILSFVLIDASTISYKYVDSSKSSSPSRIGDTSREDPSFMPCTFSSTSY